MARPSKIDDEDTRKTIITLIRAGNYIETAVELAGIDRSTFTRWMQRGKAAKRGKYREFYTAIKKAKAESEHRGIQKIQKAKAWQAEAWRLERMFHHHWGRKSPDMVPLYHVADFVSKIIGAINKAVTREDERMELAGQVESLFGGMITRKDRARGGG